MLLVLNLPLIKMWVQITKVPFRLLFPIIILICIVGVYTLKNAVFDIWIMIIFGVIGYVMKKAQYEPAPLVLAYVLGPMMEKALKQSLLISNGSFTIFFLRPISAACLGVAIFLLVTAITGFSKKKRLEVVKEQQE
jgi:putative tricarboxylic transport membrane protein